MTTTASGVRSPADPAVAVWVDADAPGASLVVCGDVGSTYTKVAVVNVATGRLVATAAHPTTIATDVLDGLAAALAAVAAVLPGADLAEIRLCSSAGGGLRLAVVGYESLVTAEAGHRVGLSAGGHVHDAGAGGQADTVAGLRRHQRFVADDRQS